MYNNFTSGIEYYYNVAADSCDLYGLNLWSDWCYGAANQQYFSKSITIGVQSASVWAQEGSPFTWTSTYSTTPSVTASAVCVPMAQHRLDSGESTYYYDMKVGAPDASVFALPTACVRAEETLLQGSKSLPVSPAHHKHF